jgi:hypothetical protein
VGTTASKDDHVHPTTNVALLNAANTFTSSPQQVNTATAATKGFIIKGAASQTATLQEWQDSAGTVLSSISSAGAASFASITSVGAVTFPATSSVSANGNLRVSPNSGALGYAFFVTSPFASTPVILVRGIASQTGNLQSWQNSASTTLTAITSAGTLNFASGNTSATATAGALTAPALVTGYITMQIAGTTVKVPYYSN